MNENQQHTATPRVQVIHEGFAMPQLRATRRIWLCLPPDYDNTDKEYPVIYMQDGQNLFDEATASYAEWGIDEFMEQVPPEQQCIIVGVDHAEADRVFEYNPYDTEEGPGKGNAYADFLVETLKPFIDQNYRTLADAAHTTIAGSSLGGLMAMFAALKYPQVFGQAGIFSPAFWIAPQIFYDAEANENLIRSRFYFACGDHESETMTKDVEGMAEILRDKGLGEENLSVMIVPGAEHNEQQWQEDFPAFYDWLIK